MKICVTCGKEFIAKSNGQKYCSEDCKLIHKYNSETKRIRRAVIGINFKKCVACGKFFEPKFRGEKFCSDKCRLTYYRHEGEYYFEKSS